MDFTEKTVKVNQIYDGKIVKLRVEDILRPDGKPAKRELIAHPGGVGIIAVTEDGLVPVVTQYRIAARSLMTEIPAGKLEYGEDPLECGIRELEEEVGLRAEKVVHLGEYYATPGYCEEKINIYLATGLTQTKQHLDDGEFLTVDYIPLDTLFEMVMENKIYDMKTALAIVKAKAVLSK